MTSLQSELQPHQLKAFSLILNAGSNGILASDLSVKLHGSLFGLDELKMNATRVTVSTMRKKIAPLGFSISSGSRPGWYRVEVAAA